MHIRAWALVALLLLAGLGGLRAQPRDAPLDAAVDAPVRTETGWTHAWFERTDLRLPRDLARATQAGKRLALIFEQRGCRYCAELHTNHLSQPEIAREVRARFQILQIDLHGTRPVVDFDGQTVEERQLARKWCVVSTPTIVFLPERPPPARADGGRRCGMEIEVARMQGLLPPAEFRAFFAYVAERAYADGTSFPAWWARRSAAR